jgi:serpin B
MAQFEISVRQMSLQSGTVELPRFKLENEYNLTQALPGMGMPLAFSNGADFGGMSDEPLHIGFVKQKTFVAVNEQGTEAAAATAIGIRPSAMRMEAPPFHIVVDRPFFMAIREKRSGLILFLGAISDPR